MKQRLSVIGLGKLGCTMMACFVHKGWQVIGVDINKSIVDTIQRDQSPIDEPYVEEMINKNKERITVTTDYEIAILNSNVSFIIVPTPSQEDGSFSTEFVETAAMKIARVLKKKESYHLVVITSTVLPGDSLRIAYDIVKESGKVLGKDFGVIYNPDFIALGKIVYDFFNPSMILIGESDEKAGNIIEDIHMRLIDNETTIHRMNFYNAELAKISLNAYCTLKITFANVIAEICEKIPGGDSTKVLKAIGSDSRVGLKYFRGGLGYSGPCLLPDALIQTDKGLKEIQDIEIGDKVFTHKGRFRKVSKTYKRDYSGDMIDIVTENKDSIILTPDHPVWSIKKIGRKDLLDDLLRVEFTPVKDLIVGDFVAVPFSEDTTKISIRWLNRALIMNPILDKDKNYCFEIRSIGNYPYKGYVHNLEVEEDNSYMLEGGVVHNCFPRDNRALAYSAKLFNTTNYFCEMTDAINNYHKTDRICNLLLRYMEEKRVKSLSILGLSYKEDVSIIEESVAILVIKTLWEKGMSVRVYDPSAIKNTKQELEGYNNIYYASSEYDCIENTAVCFIATPWNQFGNLNLQTVVRKMKKDAIILDAWGILSDESVDRVKDKIEVRQLGKNY